MEYNVYFKYDATFDLNLSDCIGAICEHVFADIMYELEEVPKDGEEDEGEGRKIGFISWLECNQVLARAYGVALTEVPYIGWRTNSNVILELDTAHISQETIDEIGMTTNPNIIVIANFGISSTYRKKGIGETVLKAFMKQMKGKYGYIVVLDSTPEQFSEHAGDYYEKQGVDLSGLENDPEKAQWKLNAFFQRCGFRLYKNYNNVFVCNIEQTVPEHIKVTRPAKRLK